jgi:tetratricopeptide (TPR) repeat protein
MTENRVYQNIPSDNSQQIHNSIIGVIGDDGNVNIQMPKSRLEVLKEGLPADINDFVGREVQQVTLIEWLSQVNASERIAPVMVSIYGMAGVGKSRLALHVLHKLKGLFPDGQIYLNLRATDEDRDISATDALFKILKVVFGLEEKEIPSEQSEREMQYRSLMAKRRVVVLIDNAFDETQISPLCPQGGTSAVLVTSRQRLEMDGKSMHLKPMGVGTGKKLGESEALLHKIVGQVNPTRVKDDLETARQIVELCGCLPLAIRIAGATLKMALWQHQTLAVFRDELAKEETRLSKLESDNLEKLHPGQGRVRPSFNLSYRALALEDQQLFRWMGGLPGKDFGVALAAEVMEAEENLINAGVARLIDAQVLEMFGSERFQFHDLMRLFAQEQLDSVERETALDRALNWYCKSANILRKGLRPQECLQLARIMAVGSQHSLERWEQRLPQLALDFFEAELDNWVTVIQQLDRRNFWNEAINLASNLTPFFALRSHFGVWVATHEIAKISANKANNRTGIAVTLGNLGLAYQDLGRWDDAISAYQESLQIHRELNDQHGIAVGLNRLANIYSELDKCQAINLYKESLQIHHELGDEIGIARVLGGLGIVYNSQGLFDDAITAFEQSIQISVELGDRHLYSQAKGNLGMVLRSQGKWDEAITAFEESLTIKREFRDRQGIAETSGNLGHLYSDQKKWREAIAAYEEDLHISHEIGDLHGEGLSLVNIGTLYLRLLQPSYAKVCFQEALIKLDPRSHAFQDVKYNLRVANCTLRFIRYVTGISISIFLLFYLLKRQYLFTIIVAFTANIIWWIIENKHSKNDALLLRKLRGLVDE